METIVDRSTLEVLRAGLRGTAYAPGEEGYDEARKAWNLNAHQHPGPRPSLRLVGHHPHGRGPYP